MSNKRKKTAKVEGKKWLLKDIIYGYSSITGMSYLPFQMFFQFEHHSNQFIFYEILRMNNYSEFLIYIKLII